MYCMPVSCRIYHHYVQVGKGMNIRVHYYCGTPFKGHHDQDTLLIMLDS